MSDQQTIDLMSGRLNAERIITLNCGMGRDSIAMLCLCVEGALYTDRLGSIYPDDLDCVVFSHTGREWKHTYDVVDRVRAICGEFGIRFVELHKGDGERDDLPVSDWRDIEERAEQGAYHLRPDIMADFQSRETVASLGKGDCTDNHKMQPIRRLINDISRVRFDLNNRQWTYRVKSGERRPHITLVGIAADETTRIPDGDCGPYYVDEGYPLADMGIPKTGESEILSRWDLDHVRKSGCYMCPYQPAGWYWALRKTDPETYQAVVEYERIAMERNPRMAVTGYKSGGDPMTIPEVVERWRKKNPDAGVAEVLEKTYTRCTDKAREQKKSEFQ